MLIKTCLPLLLAVVVSQAAATEKEWSAPLQAAETLLQAADYAAARPAYEAQAQQGNGLAQFTLGLFYQLGWGVSVSPGQSCHWFKLAAENQIPAAQEQLGYCYLNDHFASAEQSLALGWFEQAYQAGIISAGCAMGKLLVEGSYVAANPPKGMQLCQQAAISGATAAQLQLAKWLLNGVVLPQNASQAMYWFDLAANNNSAEAAYYLAQFYDTGTVVDQDATRALAWYDTAAKAGFTEAYLSAAALYFAQYQAEVQQGPVDAASTSASALLAQAFSWAYAASTALSPQHSNYSDAMALLKQISLLTPASWQETLRIKTLQHLNSLNPSV
ncbi:tetratricopeptide repeat protein [Rheinheimera maricola]|uniref:Sel1 repeat family protein n=1 Tax=Rheinheimera maricola TaxID=2793282 RepID=A0ABS7XA05_9GAMM|nr:tetratricopeptide repeat protein [Rheinheimera maricola]MBZ9612376.1 sel1 repeat family protein [Rheinheimera maricola]